MIPERSKGKMPAPEKQDPQPGRLRSTIVFRLGSKTKAHSRSACATKAELIQHYAQGCAGAAACAPQFRISIPVSSLKIDF
jgi:hypothetical protein